MNKMKEAKIKPFSQKSVRVARVTTVSTHKGGKKDNVNSVSINDKKATELWKEVRKKNHGNTARQILIK